MPYGFTPPSQKFRRISFDLSGGGASAQTDLLIRPEELTWVEPSRIAVQQTLAGAWADSFDRGVATIRISGHTGWHGGDPRGGAPGGESQFITLRNTSFQGWHDARAALVAGGQDPAAVEMIFIDELDRREALVAPKVFTLRRSKSRPLLMMYVIELLVLADAGMPTGGGAGGTGADPFGNLIGDFAGGASQLAGIANNILGAVNTGVGIANQVTSLANTAQNVINNPLGAIPGAAQFAAGNFAGGVNSIQAAINNPLGAIPGAAQAQSLANNVGGLLGGLFG